MQKTTKGHLFTMGETGMGISNQDEIDMSLNNQLTMKWGTSHGARVECAFRLSSPSNPSNDKGLLPMVF